MNNRLSSPADYESENPIPIIIKHPKIFQYDLYYFSVYNVHAIEHSAV